MEMRRGIPLISDLLALQGQEMYGRHVEFNRSFLKAHGPAIRRYGRQWGTDPFQLWSRRWEYPFAVQCILDFAAGSPAVPPRILDAGSGVTYFPYFLSHLIAGAKVTCCDSNPKYAGIFAEINRDRSAAGQGGNIEFVQAMLQSLPFAPASRDVIACISVLEHTTNYGEILAEFARVLCPGGLLVLTFDLSLDGKFELSRQKAADLITTLGRHFVCPDGTAPVGRFLKELDRIDETEAILSTDYIRNTQPGLLPWKYPLLKSLDDLLHGHGWTGGFRSKSIFCLEALAKAS